MSDDELRTAYQRGSDLRRSPGRTGCPVPEAIQGLVDRQGAEAERLKLLDHVMSCEECRRDFELLRALAEGGRSASAPARRWALPLAAAATVALVLGGTLLRKAARDEPDLERGGTLGLMPVAPRGAVESSPARLRFVWKALPEATQYEMEVVAVDGTPLYRVSTADTTAALPDSVTLSQAAEYRWKVMARTIQGSQLSSGLIRFRVRRP